MEFTITGVDYEPPELVEQLPIRVTLIRAIAGPDRPDYWIGAVAQPIHWVDKSQERVVTHVILAARHVGGTIEAGVRDLSVGIAYVTDPSLLSDVTLDLSKCEYVAIGVGHDSGLDMSSAAVGPLSRS